MDKLQEYFNGDSMASDSWQGKYQMKDKQGNPLEDTPADMHMRLATSFGKGEYKSIQGELINLGDRQNLSLLSEFGKALMSKRFEQTEQDIIDEVFSYFDKFSKIVPQGSIMSNLGNNFIYGSLSNCFVVASPEDSYGGILKTDEELVQLMKRRGGVGTSLDKLRPSNATVTNAAKSSSGVPSFAERFSNSTREVAQGGRRGALMLLLSVEHPDIFKFVKMKEDRTKVTGANITAMFSDEFMYAVEAEEDFICRFPLNLSNQYNIISGVAEQAEYNKLIGVVIGETTGYIMKIKAKELFEEFVSMAWDNAEPGAAYIDRIQQYSPDGVYERFKPTKCNPCGEIWMGDYDACRLIAQNLFGAVIKPFTELAQIDINKLYEVSYMQQRYSDILIDLEVEYIQRIIEKLRNDPEPYEIKVREIELWEKIQDTTRDGRRTGNGFTALADMLAAIGCKYSEGIPFVEEVLKTKMRAELDCTIDMAITKGTFIGWNRDLEFFTDEDTPGLVAGANDFYQMLLEEFPEQALRMYAYGRRNVSWSTVAPTGTVSLMTQTTSGLEPLFQAYYIRRKKINPNEPNVRIDFTDQNGDTWQEYPVLHPKFKDWIINYLVSNITFTDGLLKDYKLQVRDVDLQLMNELISYMDKEKIQSLFELSPWYQSQADDIDWKSRIAMNSVIQKYTTNSLSCTINLPKDISKEAVYGIYMEAWKKGLKGITIYRDGSRSGVLITETESKLTNCDEFGYTDAIKRPKELEADYFYVTSKGRKYAVFVGKLNGNPYELFAFEDPIRHDNVEGKIVKVKRGIYSFASANYTVDNLQLNSELSDEKLLTRWVSMLLRHGANPKYIAEQVEKSEMQVTSFAKCIARVLKKYIPDEEAIGEICPECNQATISYQEGCKKCTNCGYSKC